MIHPNEEQPDPVPAGSDAHAVRNRLRSAFASVRAPEELARRIRAGTVDAPAKPVRSRVIRLWRVVPLAVAACLLLAAGLVWQIGLGQAAAAQPELAGIHDEFFQYQAGDNRFLDSDDPAELAAFLQRKLGSVPVFPKPSETMAVKCCCKTKFRGREVGSYLLTTAEGPVSVVAVTDSLESLGLKCEVRQGPRLYRACMYGDCNIVAYRLGMYTYCAVGRVPQETLLRVLGLLTE